MLLHVADFELWTLWLQAQTVCMMLKGQCNKRPPPMNGMCCPPQSHDSPAQAAAPVLVPEATPKPPPKSTHMSAPPSLKLAPSTSEAGPSHSKQEPVLVSSVWTNTYWCYFYLSFSLTHTFSLLVQIYLNMAWMPNMIHDFFYIAKHTIAWHLTWMHWHRLRFCYLGYAAKRKLFVGRWKLEMKVALVLLIMMTNLELHLLYGVSQVQCPVPVNRPFRPGLRQHHRGRIFLLKNFFLVSCPKGDSRRKVNLRSVATRKLDSTTSHQQRQRHSACYKGVPCSFTRVHHEQCWR